MGDADPAGGSEVPEHVIERHAKHIREGYRKLASGEFTVPDSLGGPRWPGELLVATWEQARTGRPPEGLEYRHGQSGGGFDELHFQTSGAPRWRDTRPTDEEPPSPESRRELPVIGPQQGEEQPHMSATVEKEDDQGDGPDLAVPLNRRSDLPSAEISLPVYGAGMSYGSVSLPVMQSRAQAARRLGTYTSTGEGGYPEALKEYGDHVITQIATGLFGVREETIQRAPIVEFKYAQGAKPGLGGHLLADKVTADVAEVRGAVAFSSLFSPFPFHSVYSVEDHKKHVDWIRTVNPNALISVKVSTPTDVDMVAIGSYYAGAHIVHLDGGYGGTGAAPEIAKKNIAMPIEYAVPIVHRELKREGIRDEVTLIASGGVRTAYDVAKAIALGADGCVIGTAELVAMGCTMCHNCELGRGCPYGLTTTDPELSQLIEPEWGGERIVNLYTSWSLQWRDLLTRLDLDSIQELRGRTDLLRHERYGNGHR